MIFLDFLLNLLLFELGKCAICVKKALSFGASRTGFYPSVRAAQASHTQLRQLADFPSLKVRSSFAHPSLGRIMNSEF